MSNIATKLTYLNGTKQAIKQAINEDFEVIDNNTTFREYADEISSNNAKYKDLIPKETKNATNTLDISNSAGLDKALVTLYGNTYQDGEPTPDAPVEIQVVTGDNEVKVQNKNLTLKNVKGYFGSNSILIDNGSESFVFYATQGETYTFSSQTAMNRGQYAKVETLNIVNNTPISNKTSISVASSYNSATFTCSFTGYCIVYVNSTANNAIAETFQIEVGTTSTTYVEHKGYTKEINLGSIELCKIGDYQDKIAKSTGKNLFDKSTITENKTLNGETGELINSSVSNLTDYIEISPNTIYTLTYNYFSLLNTADRGFGCYDSNKNLINSGGYQAISKTNYFIAPQNAKYIRFGYDRNCFDIMLNEGNTALPYEPYGKVWYLNKQIGKVVLDGSNYPLFGDGGSSNDYWEYFRNRMIGGIGTQASAVTNYFNQTTNSRVVIVNNGTLYLRFPKNLGIDISTNTLLNNWLSTHNTIVYYVLATPTTEEITENNYPTLYNQLNNIKLFEGVNHITMTNESGLDVEFDITYYKDWKLD